MEGLHHDTNLDPISPVPDNSPIDKGDSQELEVNPHNPSSSNEDNFASASINQSLTAEEKIDLYDQMVRIRRFEERSLRSYQQGHIGGFLHLYIGQEAVAVGSVSILGEDDHVITAYRDHGHALAVGMNMDECMAELYGKKDGLLKRKRWLNAFLCSRQKFLGRAWYCWGANSSWFGYCICIKALQKERLLSLLYGRWCH